MLPEHDYRRIEILDEEMVEVLRKKTPAERLAIAFDCNRTVRLRLETHLRSQHAQWTDAEISAEVGRRMASGTE